MINHDPVLATVANQTVTTGSSVTVSLTATDEDPGDALTLSATVVSVDQYAQLAYEWRTTYGLTTTGNLNQNFRGLNEKYLLGKGNLWYYILPNGELYVWTDSIESSALIGKLTSAYWEDPLIALQCPRAQRDLDHGDHGESLRIGPDHHGRDRRRLSSAPAGDRRQGRHGRSSHHGDGL